MKTIKGAYTSAQIFTTKNKEIAIDPYAISQLQMICDQESSKGCRICVMPDVHPGKVGTIGLTMTIGEKILPNLIGIDIGCGMTLAQIKGKKLEYQKLDTVIRDSVPSRFGIRAKVHRFADEFDFDALRCANHIHTDKARLSLGSLGSGNHFIEADKDVNGNLYIVIHTGSRHLGKEVTEIFIIFCDKGCVKSVPYRFYCSKDINIIRLNQINKRFCHEICFCSFDIVNIFLIILTFKCILYTDVFSFICI